MQVTHVLWSLGTGGIETMLVDIINEQVKTIEVSLIIINDLINDGIYRCISKKCKVFRCSRKIGSKNPLPILRLNYYLYQLRPDVIHVHLPGLARIVFYPWAKLVRTIHNTGLSASDYGKCDMLFAISDAVRTFTSSQGFSSDTISNGIHIDRIRKKADVGTLPCGKVFTMVQVSRLYHQQKGQDILIEALSVLKNKRGRKNFMMHFIGEGESRNMLEDLVQKYGLNKNVRFLGLRDRQYIYQHLSDYDLFIQPSRYEGFGLTVAEAMAAKIPVLVSNIEGPMEIVQNGKLGFTFQNKSIEDLADKLEYIMFNIYDENNMIEDAYNHVARLYDIRLTAEKYIEAYINVLS